MPMPTNLNEQILKSVVARLMPISAKLQAALRRALLSEATAEFISVLNAAETERALIKAVESLQKELDASPNGKTPSRRTSLAGRIETLFHDELLLLVLSRWHAEEPAAEEAFEKYFQRNLVHRRAVGLLSKLNDAEIADAGQEALVKFWKEYQGTGKLKLKHGVASLRTSIQTTFRNVLQDIDRKKEREPTVVLEMEDLVAKADKHQHETDLEIPQDPLRHLAALADDGRAVKPYRLIETLLACRRRARRDGIESITGIDVPLPNDFGSCSDRVRALLDALPRVLAALERHQQARIWRTALLRSDASAAKEFGLKDTKDIQRSVAKFIERIIEKGLLAPVEWQKLDLDLPTRLRDYLESKKVVRLKDVNGRMNPFLPKKKGAEHHRNAELCRRAAGLSVEDVEVAVKVLKGPTATYALRERTLVFGALQLAFLDALQAAIESLSTEQRQKLFGFLGAYLIHELSPDLQTQHGFTHPPRIPASPHRKAVNRIIAELSKRGFALFDHGDEEREPDLLFVARSFKESISREIKGYV